MIVRTNHVLNVMICSNMFYLALTVWIGGPVGPSSLDIVQRCLIILSQSTLEILGRLDCSIHNKLAWKELVITKIFLLALIYTVIKSLRFNYFLIVSRIIDCFIMLSLERDAADHMHILRLGSCFVRISIHRLLNNCREISLKMSNISNLSDIMNIRILAIASIELWGFGATYRWMLKVE